ncbi:MAG: diguanylate cyclase, partial [Deltaproteobacteria bacterium]
ALDEVRGKDWFEVFVPPDQREVRRRSELETRGLSEQSLLTRAGQARVVRWTLTPLRDRDGNVIGSAGVGADVTALVHDPFHDPLTGLPNRALFIDRLSHRLALEQRRPRASFAVLFLDVDRFKVINDSLGHVRGDAVLLEVGRRLQSCLRPHDTVARLGGDEFGVLLEDVPDTQSARRVADRLQDALKAPFVLHGQEVFCGASIGIAHGSASYVQPEDIMRDADTALYRAKGQGRGRWVEFDSTMHDRAVELLQLETDLRRALERRELRLHYQPVVSLSTGSIVGAEALIRWQHPERGLVAPAEFIPLAEEMGLIVPIGAWVLSEACRQMKEWQERLGMPDLEIGVNLSSKQFLAPGLVAEVGRVLSETGLSPQSLRLEVTESLLMDRHLQVADAMTGLRAMGVRIDLDDFGTGYSSLSGGRGRGDGAAARAAQAASLLLRAGLPPQPARRQRALRGAARRTEKLGGLAPATEGGLGATLLLRVSVNTETRSYRAMSGTLDGGTHWSTSQSLASSTVAKEASLRPDSITISRNIIRLSDEMPTTAPASTHGLSCSARSLSASTTRLSCVDPVTSTRVRRLRRRG